MGAVALDASVVIAVLDPADAHHSEAVSVLEAAADRGDAMTISASAYAEVLVHPIRSQRDDIVDAFLDRLGVEIAPLERPLARRAAALRARHPNLRFPDALVLATAQETNAQLLTFDDRLDRFAARAATD